MDLHVEIIPWLTAMHAVSGVLAFIGSYYPAAAIRGIRFSLRGIRVGFRRIGSIDPTYVVAEQCMPGRWNDSWMMYVSFLKQDRRQWGFLCLNKVAHWTVILRMYYMTYEFSVYHRRD